MMTSALPSSNSGKIKFANQLRGVCFLLVIFGHLCGLFFWSNQQLGQHLNLIPVNVYHNIYIDLLPPVPSFNYGIFGVSIFFLISGFVIPFSLQKKTRIAFLISRAIRIYPTYIACLCTSLAIVFLCNLAEEKAFNFSLGDVIANCLLVNNLIEVGSIDWVNWTLAIEIKYYIVSAALYVAIRSRNFIAVLLYCSSVAMLSILMRQYPVFGGFGDAMLSDLQYTTYMFIGTIIYFNFIGAIDVKKTLFSISFILCSFYITWLNSKLSPLIADFYPNYLYGLVTFLVCYKLRDKFKENRLLDFLANISYPGYALHAMSGYALLFLLVNRGFGYYTALSLSLFVIFILSYFLHKTVEIKTISFGKRVK